MAEFDKSKFDPKAAAQARKEEMDEISKKLETGVKDIFTSEGYQKYLDFCAKLPRYSVNNQILIMMQKPDATMCQSFTGWKEMGRFVKAGEKGIRVLAPSPYKVEREQDKLDSNGNVVRDKDGEPVKEMVEIKVNAFKPVSTFDISQTDGKPIPQFGVDELTQNVEGYEILSDAIQKASPVPIEFGQIDSGAKGYYHVEEKRIMIQEGMSEAQTVKTMLHEASHAMLYSKEALEASGEKKSRNQKECEAESVAYVVSQHYGIDTGEYSFAYVAGWSENSEVPELKASLDTIRKAAAELITKIDEIVQEKTSFAEIDQWVEAHGDELPFADPDGHLPSGFIQIVPPADMGIDESKEKKSVKEKMAGKAEKKKAKPKKVDNKDLGEAI